MSISSGFRGRNGIFRQPEPPVGGSLVLARNTFDTETEKYQKLHVSIMQRLVLLLKAKVNPMVFGFLLPVFAISQIAWSLHLGNYGDDISITPYFLQARRALNAKSSHRISSFDAKPYALEFDVRDGSVVPIDLKWFRIEDNMSAAELNYIKDTPESNILPNGCSPMYDWQETFYPTCNKVHEMDISAKSRHDQARMVSNGYWRDVWEYKEEAPGKSSSWALKTLRYKHDKTKKFLKEQQIDSIISEKLTFSPSVANIYGYCGMAAIYDFAKNGTLLEHYAKLGHEERLRTAAFISRGLADLHMLGGGKHASVVHTDVDVRQFIHVDGNFLLNDFNTAGLLFYNEETKTPCTWMLRHPYDKNRSPEEHAADLNYINEKIDVYSLGNIFYKLLTNKQKYDDIHTPEAEKLILKGDIPKLSDELEESKDPVHVALKEAMRQCLIFDPNERASAKEVADNLEEAWKKVEKKTL